MSYHVTPYGMSQRIISDHILSFSLERFVLGGGVHKKFLLQATSGFETSWQTFCGTILSLCVLGTPLCPSMSLCACLVEDWPCRVLLAQRVFGFLALCRECFVLEGA